MKAVFDAVPVGIVIARLPSGRVVMRNPQAEAILGPVLEVAQAGGEWELFDRHGRRIQARENPLLRAIGHGETSAMRVFCYREEDGPQVWVSVSAAPIRGVTGSIIGGVMTLQDVETVQRASAERHGATGLVFPFKRAGRRV